MKKYCIERNNLYPEYENNRLNLYKVIEYWLDIYFYFKNEECFQYAEDGLKRGKNIVPLKFAPSPEYFLFMQTGKKDLWPLDYDYIKRCDEATIFTLIEIYYDAIDKRVWNEGLEEWESVPENSKYKKQYCEYVNKILRYYKNGYILEESLGIITEEPNNALKEQFKYSGKEISEKIFTRLQDSQKMYYRFDSTPEQKKKAICTLADILENIKKESESLFGKVYNLDPSINKHLIFQIVNQYGIRHDNNKQIDDPYITIWYDWMMQYYTSTIIAFYRTNSQKELEEFF